MESQTKRPPSLSETQDWLRWIFTEPNGVENALQTVHSPSPFQGEGRVRVQSLKRRDEPQPRLLHWIEDGPPIGVQRRLSVYSDAYFLRLLDSLSYDFQAVRRALGAEPFQRLTAEYLAGHPSTSKNISDLGKDFPAFITTHPISREFSFLPDLARLEWGVLISLFTDRLPPFDPASIQNIPADAWPDAILIPDPTVALLDLDWPVDKLWQRRGKPESDGLRRLSQSRSRRLLLYRDDDWAQIHPLDPMERTILGMILEGRPLGFICQQLESGAKQTAIPDLQALFSGWIAQGVIKRIQVP